MLVSLFFSFFASEHEVPSNDDRALWRRRNKSDTTSKRKSHITTQRVGYERERDFNGRKDRLVVLSWCALIWYNCACNQATENHVNF